MIYKIRTKEKGILACRYKNIETMFVETEAQGLTVIEFWVNPN